MFTDPDGDVLTIIAASSDNAKAAVTVAFDQSKLAVSGVAEGTATITVTVQDADGNEVKDDFDVSAAKAPSRSRRSPARWWTYGCRPRLIASPSLERPVGRRRAQTLHRAAEAGGQRREEQSEGAQGTQDLSRLPEPGGRCDLRGEGVGSEPDGQGQAYGDTGNPAGGVSSRRAAPMHGGVRQCWTPLSIRQHRPA